MTVVTIHQPHFLPWEPYLSRIAYADIFVVLDDVEFRKQYFHNRALIDDGNDRFTWVTIPVRNFLKNKISSIEISKDLSLRKSIYKLDNGYRRYSDHREFLERIQDAIFHSSNLVELNLRLINHSLDYLNFAPIKLLFSSSVSKSDDRTQRIIDICNFTGASKLLTGWGSSTTVHNINRIRDTGVAIIQQDRLVYESFLGSYPIGISILHTICVEGVETVRVRMSKDQWKQV